MRRLVNNWVFCKADGCLVRVWPRRGFLYCAEHRKKLAAQARALTRRTRGITRCQHDAAAPRPAGERYAVPFIRIHARCGFRGCTWPATAVWATFGGGRRYQFLLCGGCSSMLFMASRKSDATPSEIAALVEGPPFEDHTITIVKHKDDK